MDTLQNLALKTATARTRLADLQRKADQIPRRAAALVRPALRELSAAIGALELLNEHMLAQRQELASLRREAASARRRLEEYARMVPTACVWTDAEGMVHEGNDASCALLNVSPARLVGKPLMLYVPDREKLFATLRRLAERVVPEIEVDMLVRPRERRPRRLRVRACLTEHDTRLVWFLQEPPAEPPRE